MKKSGQATSQPAKDRQEKDIERARTGRQTNRDKQGNRVQAES